MVFRQENATGLKSTVAIAAIHKCGLQLGEDRPCSPDLVPANYCLFPKMIKLARWSSLCQMLEKAVYRVLKDTHDSFHIEAMLCSKATVIHLLRRRRLYGKTSAFVYTNTVLY